MAAVHCKAGKGRTGLVVVCYLLYSGFRPDAASARAYYDSERTKDCKGLTIISQVPSEGVRAHNPPPPAPPGGRRLVVAGAPSGARKVLGLAMHLLDSGSRYVPAHFAVGGLDEGNLL